MSSKEVLIQEVMEVPDALVEEILDFVLFLKHRRKQETMETTLLSESSLRKDWNKPEEDKAWQPLSLDTLLKGINADNLHGETSTGDPVGNEYGKQKEGSPTL